MTSLLRSAVAIALAMWTAPALAGTCTDLSNDGETFSVCTVTAPVDLRLWLYGDDGTPIGTFKRLRDRVEAQGARLIFAMNAGMYHPDRRPVGLFALSGRTLAPLVTRAGPGNFGMLPNGVFCIRNGGFAVIDSADFDSAPACRDASQSGPMLVIGGALHPRFLPDSDSLHVRNGVGVSADGQTAHFAISARPVSFHAFARLFRDALDTPNALYFDGNVSRLYAPELGRDDPGYPMGPIIGLVAPAR